MLEWPAAALCPPCSCCATFWAEVVQSRCCGVRKVMGCPVGSSSGGKVLAAAEEDFLGWWESISPLIRDD